MDAKYVSPEILRRLPAGVASFDATENDEWTLPMALLGGGPGFYVDVGAFDPVVCSQTAAFHKAGWTGINIEPQLDRYLRFCQARPGDRNLNIGIAAEEGFQEMLLLANDAASTFSREQAEREKERHGHAIEGSVSVRCMPLSRVLARFAPDRAIDVMSIDVEGLELEVIQSGDWDRFRPTFLIVETFHVGLEPAVSLLSSLGYDPAFLNTYNGVFVDHRWLR